MIRLTKEISVEFSAAGLELAISVFHDLYPCAYNSIVIKQLQYRFGKYLFGCPALSNFISLRL